MPSFDEVIAVHPISSSSGLTTFSAHLSTNWTIGNAPLGGYLVAIVLNALKTHNVSVTGDKHKDCFHINVTFLNKPDAGRDVEITVKDVKRGRTYAVCSVEMWQEKRHILTTLSTHSSFSAEKGPTYPQHSLAPFTLFKDCHPITTTLGPVKRPAIDNIEICVDPAIEELKRTERLQWIRLVNEPSRPIDEPVVAMFADCLSVPPPYLHGQLGEGKVAWFPTLTLEIQFRAPTSLDPQWIHIHYIAKMVKNGRFDIDVEVRDEKGEVLALSRHLCTIVDAGKVGHAEGKVTAKI
ncbi:hypothetical protein SAICODRAFT_20330 [Saitoella complicata NRRL Y-17804]|nr:uncharacterized protein SAICODRAFT_20330 [Saitoella complicata NRRL Y-17804]ODQ51660.1 hypothetical protein SAICODRAFT_20330 [Saitoella complicata NRRL Y-17804]